MLIIQYLLSLAHNNNNYHSRLFLSRHFITYRVAKANIMHSKEYFRDKISFNITERELLLVIPLQICKKSLPLPRVLWDNKIVLRNGKFLKRLIRNRKVFDPACMFPLLPLRRPRRQTRNVTLDSPDIIVDSVILGTDMWRCNYWW